MLRLLLKKLHPSDILCNLLLQGRIQCERVALSIYQVLLPPAILFHHFFMSDDDLWPLRFHFIDNFQVVILDYSERN